MRDQLHLSAAILARWHCPLASTRALDLLHQAMRAVLYWHTTVAIKMARKVEPFFVVLLFAVALTAAGAIQGK
jgi:hypothetical protein